MRSTGSPITILCKPNSKFSHVSNYLFRWLTDTRFYNAHETTAVTDFAIALLCGDVRCDFYAGVLILDGNRARFAVSDWKTMLVIRTLRTRLREIMTRSFKNPGKPLTGQQARWLEIWQKIFSQETLVPAKTLMKNWSKGFAWMTKKGGWIGS